MKLPSFDFSRLVPDITCKIVDKKLLSVIITNTLNCFKSSSSIGENRPDLRNINSNHAIEVIGPARFNGLIQVQTQNAINTSQIMVDLEPGGFLGIGRVSRPGLDPSVPSTGVDLRWHLPLI